VQEISNLIIKEFKNNSFLFTFAFLVTIENYNSMNLLENISEKLGIKKIVYIDVHKHCDHCE